MGMPILSEWFSFSGRRNRKSYILAIVALFAITTFAIVIWCLFAQTGSGRIVGILLFGLPMEIFTYLLSARRLRDMNISGWLCLSGFFLNFFSKPIELIFSLIIIVVLFCVRGTRGANKFGADPLGGVDPLEVVFR
jgi:uncharacterized membrane protein YhaH (DUF805 family)